MSWPCSHFPRTCLLSLARLASSQLFWYQLGKQTVLLLELAFSLPRYLTSSIQSYIIGFGRMKYGFSGSSIHFRELRYWTFSCNMSLLGWGTSSCPLTIYTKPTIRMWDDTHLLICVYIVASFLTLADDGAVLGWALRFKSKVLQLANDTHQISIFWKHFAIILLDVYWKGM